MAATMINVAVVTEIIAKARRHIADQRASLSDIEGMINTMQGIWDAEEQRICANRFAESKKKFDAFNDGMIATIDKLQTYINDCVDADGLSARDLRTISW